MSLKRREFKVLSTWIYDTLGVKMPPTKLILLESRLQKRLRALGMEKFNSYIEYVFSEDGCAQELPFMVDLVTTHQTDFFREEAHFDFLTQTALPELIQRFEVGTHRPLQLWSAASSTGEEAYTLGIVLEEFAQAEVQAATLREIIESDLATKHDIELIRHDTELVKKEIKDTETRLIECTAGVEASLTERTAGVEASLTERIAGVEASLTERIAGAEASLIERIVTVAAENKTTIAETKAEIIKWVAGLMPVQAGLIVTLLKLL